MKSYTTILFTLAFAMISNAIVANDMNIKDRLAAKQEQKKEEANNKKAAFFNKKACRQKAEKYAEEYGPFVAYHAALAGIGVVTYKYCKPLFWAGCGGLGVLYAMAFSMRNMPYL